MSSAVQSDGKSITMLPKFHHPQLLITALTHRSALNEHKSGSQVSNERLEFLGDAILEMIVSEYLYQRFTDQPEGMLTAYRSALVKTTTLAEVARELNLGDQIYMSYGEEAGGGRQNTSLLADTLEAVIGAIYLDQGYATTVNYVTSHLISKVDDIIAQGTYKDAKSALQELIQARGLPTPHYTIDSQTGPDHDKQYLVSVKIGKKVIGQGRGKSKQTAQQAAAQIALEQRGEWLV